MQETKDILEKLAGKNAGMTVPEGFFDSFNKKMAESLPEQPWEKESSNEIKIIPRSRWQIIRPYMYLAVMGIWCMMEMFNLIQSPNSLSGIESNPVLMSAIDNDAFFYDYCTDDISEADIYDELYDFGVNVNDISATID